LNKHTAVLPDGNISTRNSASRTYTHAVAYKQVVAGIEDPRWYVASYAGNLALAEKAKAGLEARFFHKRNENHFAGTAFAIVEVQVA